MEIRARPCERSFIMQKNREREIIWKLLFQPALVQV